MIYVPKVVTGGLVPPILGELEAILEDKACTHMHLKNKDVRRFERLPTDWSQVLSFGVMAHD